MTIEIFPTVAQLDAYINASGEITLEQQGLWGEEPSLVYVPIDRVEALVSALYALKALAEQGE